MTSFYVQTKIRSITCYFSPMFIVLKVFCRLYFINSLFQWKSGKKLTQVSIRNLKSAIFLTLKLNEKKKVPLEKNMVWKGRMLHENVCRKGMFDV